MTNRQLDGILNAVEEPVRPPEYWEDFPHSVRVQLRRGQDSVSPATRWDFRLAWGITVAVTCLVIGFLARHWREQEDVANGLLQNVNAVHEMLAEFPNQVRAIVQNGQGINFVLSDRQDVPDSPPLYIQVCDGKHCSFIITFSGQEVEIAGQKMTALSDAKGGVILVGDRFLWSKEEPQRLAGALRIKARELPSTGAS